MKTYNISVSGELSVGSATYEFKKTLLKKLKNFFVKYNNVSLHHEYYGDTFSRISFAVNDMKNIIFTIDLSTSRSFLFSICKADNIESEVYLTRFQPASGQIIGNSYTDKNGNRWYPINIYFNMNVFENNGKLVAFLAYNGKGTVDDAIVFGKDNFDRNYIYFTYNNKLYYDNSDYIECRCDSDKLATNIDGYVYLKKNICIYKNNYVVGTTNTVVIICNTNLGTSTNNTYLNLIDIDGTKYRQLKANIWIEDKEE